MGADFELTYDELRAVARFAVESAQTVLPVFEEARPDDGRPRAAIDAAHEFISGARRSRLQRLTSIDAHRAAAEAPSIPARLAARAAGDAGAAAYLHPIARATQVGHILRASACAALVAELVRPEKPDVADKTLRDIAVYADPLVVEVLRRYPPAVPGGERLAQLMSRLDGLLRAR
ncbi:putative immunity protein [Gordonia soli]|uniref:Imm-5-like domain-containing protein n=1 Tax=Gordonia soli NBRC 108243 TaxID=1223545 RepID=M0QDY8_9ACTN|nr:hypothetical protein [Gordonia soli]GAC66659.1 hypothetical protein GS4_03_01070 [Gordonia soli NBRC 108243]